VRSDHVQLLLQPSKSAIAADASLESPPNVMKMQTVADEDVTWSNPNNVYCMAMRNI
jgi:hypothetical protein